MEFPFPPAPPGYTSVIVARCLLVVWTVIGMGILCGRLRRWKFIRSQEIFWWCLAAGVCWFVAAFGTCHDAGYDANDWLLPAEAAALSVSAAGIAIGLSKIYVEGSAREKYFALGIIPVATLVLGFILLPSVCYPREASRRSQCKNNLKQIGLAMHVYHDRYGVLPPSAGGDEPVSWRISILPFLEQPQLFEQYDQRNAWNHAANDKVARQRVDNLICLSNYSRQQDADSRWFTSYAMLTGPHTVGAKRTGTSFKDMIDGSSNTLLVVESCGKEIVWTEPRDVDTSKQPAGINLKGKKPGRSEGWMSSYHYRGAHAALADGSVRFLPADIDPKVLKKLSTIDQNDPFPW